MKNEHCGYNFKPEEYSLTLTPTCSIRVIFLEKCNLFRYFDFYITKFLIAEVYFRSDFCDNCFIEIEFIILSLICDFKFYFNNVNHNISD